MSTSQKVTLGELQGQKMLIGMLKINGKFSTYNYIKISGEDESILLIKDGIFVEPSMILSDSITSTVDQMQLLKDDIDIVELYDGSQKCIACSKVITANPMDVVDVLITHKLLCRQLQKIYSVEKESSETYKQDDSELRPADAKRKLILEADDLIGAVERDTVYCKSCEKWIRLVGKTFNASNWYGHRSRKHMVIGDYKSTQTSESRAPKSQASERMRGGMAKRKRNLESDPLLGVVERHRVWCRICKKFVVLSGGAYRTSNWDTHRGRRHPSVNEDLKEGKEDSDDTYSQYESDHSTRSSNTDFQVTPVQTRSSNRNSNLTSNVHNITGRAVQYSKELLSTNDDPENVKETSGLKVVPPSQKDKPMPARADPERILPGRKRSQSDRSNDATQAIQKNRKTRQDVGFPTIPTDLRVRRVIWEFED